MAVAVSGLQARQRETVFAFLALRMRKPIGRDGLVEVVRYLASLVPDAEDFIAGMPSTIEESIVVVGIPWTPPEAGHAVDGQRKLIEGAESVGVEAAWFFQTGTSVPSSEDEETESDVRDADADNDLDGDQEAALHTETMPALEEDDGWSSAESTDTKSAPLATVEDDSEELATNPLRPVTAPVLDDEDDVWSFGAPPQVERTRFPVDGYPELVDELDREDFGIAFKLAGEPVPGENTLLLGFHALWLAPYGGRYRNSSVTFDRTHHAAHLWVDRFAVPCSATQQVKHLLWIVSKIDEVLPIVHARLGGATMAQKYGGMLGTTVEPFVLGGNPLIAEYAAGGDAAVDAWIAETTAWSKQEIGCMLREIAIDIVTTARGEDEQPDNPDHDEPEVRASFAAADVQEAGDGVDLDDELGPGSEQAPDDGDDDRDEDDEQGRYITTFGAELLRARALAGKLDSRVAAAIVPLLSSPDKFEHRRRAIVEIIGAMRYLPAVPELMRILEATPIKNALDSIGKDDFVASAAAALGALGDPSAIAALSRVVTAPGLHNDEPRVAAADALASCLAAAPEPRDVDDAVLMMLLATIEQRNDADLDAECHVAYGRIAAQLADARRAHAKRLLAERPSTREEPHALLAHHAALALASPTPYAATAATRELMHHSLTAIEADHDATVRKLRLALRIAGSLPDLVEPSDLTWLTRFAEHDVRTSAQELLAKLGHPMPPARAISRAAARDLDDQDLVDLINEPHVVGRAALVAEAGRRKLATATRAIITACHDVIARAPRDSTQLLDPDLQLLEVAVKTLRARPLDAATIALFDRMLRSPSFHVKSELLQDPPKDERLIGGMFYVLGQRWGWQGETAKQWLAGFAGTDPYELARRLADASDDDDNVDEDPDEADRDDVDVPDDDQMN